MRKHHNIKQLTIIVVIIKPPYNVLTYLGVIQLFRQITISEGEKAPLKWLPHDRHVTYIA